MKLKIIMLLLVVLVTACKEDVESTEVGIITEVGSCQEGFYCITKVKANGVEKVWRVEGGAIVGATAKQDCYLRDEELVCIARVVIDKPTKN